MLRASSTALSTPANLQLTASLLVLSTSILLVYHTQGERDPRRNSCICTAIAGTTSPQPFCQKVVPDIRPFATHPVFCRHGNDPSCFSTNCRHLTLTSGQPIEARTDTFAMLKECSPAGSSEVCQGLSPTLVSSPWECVPTRQPSHMEHSHTGALHGLDWRLR